MRRTRRPASRTSRLGSSLSAGRPPAVLAVRLLLCVGLAALTGACATGREVLELDVSPALTWEEIRGGRIGVVGLLPEPLAGPDDPGGEETLLGRVLRRERADLDALDERSLDRALPPGIRESILQAYLHGETLPPDDGTFANALPGVRYLLLAQVEREDTDRDDVEEIHGEVRDGRPCNVDRTRHTALRQMVVRLELVEVATGRPVMMSRISQTGASETEEETWDSCESIGSNIFGGIIRALFGVGDPPDVPSRARVLEELYEGFTDQLPRKP